VVPPCRHLYRHGWSHWAFHHCRFELLLLACLLVLHPFHLCTLPLCHAWPCHIWSHHFWLLLRCPRVECCPPQRVPLQCRSHRHLLCRLCPTSLPLCRCTSVTHRKGHLHQQPLPPDLVTGRLSTLLRWPIRSNTCTRWSLIAPLALSSPSTN
jgi:hypothetical protein